MNTGAGRSARTSPCKTQTSKENKYDTAADTKTQTTLWRKGNLCPHLLKSAAVPTTRGQRYAKTICQNATNRSTWSYENRVSEYFVISFNVPCPIACLPSSLLMSFFFWVVLWLRLCVDMAVDRILRIFIYPAPLLPPSVFLFLFLFFFYPTHNCLLKTSDGYLKLVGAQKLASVPFSSVHFVSLNFSYKILPEFNVSDANIIESLFVEISIPRHENKVIGVIYRPPYENSLEFIEKINEIISGVNKGNKHCYITRDAYRQHFYEQYYSILKKWFDHK